jgi:hypothetical protein
MDLFNKSINVHFLFVLNLLEVLLSLTITVFPHHFYGFPVTKRAL